MKIRVVKTASKARAMQVVRYQNNKRIVLQHISSAHTQEALNDLMILADEWIKDRTSQLSIFPNEAPNKLLHLNYSTFIGVKYRFFLRSGTCRSSWMTCLVKRSGSDEDI